MNSYWLKFPFRGVYYDVKVSADQIANEVMAKNETNGFWEFRMETDKQNLEETFKAEDGEMYVVTFCIDNPFKLSVYNTQENGDTLIESMPWLLVAVENEEGQIVYNIGNEYE